MPDRGREQAPFRLAICDQQQAVERGKKPGGRFAGAGKTKKECRKRQGPPPGSPGLQPGQPAVPRQEAEEQPTEDKHIVLPEHDVQGHDWVEAQKRDQGQLGAWLFDQPGREGQRDHQQQQVDESLVIEPQRLTGKIEWRAEEESPRQSRDSDTARFCSG